MTSSSIIGDVRYAVRQLRRNPGFAIVAILTMALGIAATTAAYSALSVSLMRRIPVRDLGRVVGLWSLDRSSGRTGVVVSAADFIAWRERARSFETVAAQRLGGVNVSGIDQPARISAMFVSASYFDVTGVQPSVGRGFTTEENEAGRVTVAILSDRFWRSRFAARAEAVGQTVLINGRI